MAVAGRGEPVAWVVAGMAAGYSISGSI